MFVLNLSLHCFITALIPACTAGSGTSDDDRGPSDESSESSAPTDDGETTGSTSADDDSGSTQADVSTSGETDSEGSESSGDSGQTCEADFDPLPEGALPRCSSETLDCWLACPDSEPERTACIEACWAADTTPPIDLDDGSQVDCGRCINGMFEICWHDACPAESEASSCCIGNSGCDPECLANGVCDEQDVLCVQEACANEFAAEGACLEQTGAGQSCLIENDGLPRQCFPA